MTEPFIITIITHITYTIVTALAAAISELDFVLIFRPHVLYYAINDYV